MGIKLGNAATTKSKQAQLTRIFKSFGLVTCKVDGGNDGLYYKLNIQALNRMMDYAQIEVEA